MKTLACSFKHGYSFKKQKVDFTKFLFSLGIDIFTCNKDSSEDHMSSAKPMVSCLFNHFVKKKGTSWGKFFSHGNVSTILLDKPMRLYESLKMFYS